MKILMEVVLQDSLLPMSRRCDKKEKQDSVIRRQSFMKREEVWCENGVCEKKDYHVSF